MKVERDINHTTHFVRNIVNHTLDRRIYSEMESEMNCESESRKVTNLIADLADKKWFKNSPVNSKWQEPSPRLLVAWQ